MTRISGTGRFRLASRIAVTNRTTPSSGRVPRGRHTPTSMPLGSTDTSSASPTTRRSGAAATSETALMAMPPAAHRRTTPIPDTTDANRSSMQCHVIAVGRPMRRVRNAASTANGLTTPMCTWATSKVASRSRIVSGANGLTGRSHGSRSAIRWTVIPSTTSVAPCRSPCVPGWR